MSHLVTQIRRLQQIALRSLVINTVYKEPFVDVVVDSFWFKILARRQIRKLLHRDMARRAFNS